MIDSDFIAELVDGVIAGFDKAEQVRGRLTEEERKLFDLLLREKNEQSDQD